MRAFHVMWAMPSVHSKHRSGISSRFAPSNSHVANASNFDLHDYDILLTILSVLKWKDLNGSIKLYADSVAASRYYDLGILDLWDETNTDLFDSINCNSINPTLFWSGAKFFAYLNEPSPCVIIDTDIIVWENIDRFYSGVDLRFTHWEAIREPWYCRRKGLIKPETYHFRRDWDWSNTIAVNTAIVYFGNEELKNYYASEGIRFMTGHSIGTNFPKLVTPEMLFVEQRLLPMATKARGLSAAPFINAIWDPKLGWFKKHDPNLGEWLFFKPNRQQLFTHAWFYKRHLEVNSEARRDYCKTLIDIIADDFPGTIPMLEKIECLHKYFYDS